MKNLTDFGRFSVEAGVDPRLNKNLTPGVILMVFWREKLEFKFLIDLIGSL